jgi:hypothetical protein
MLYTEWHVNDLRLALGKSRSYQMCKPGITSQKR